MKKITLLTGRRGSGKTIFLDIAKNLGFGTLELSTVVFELMKKANIEATSENTGKFAEELRKKEGRDAVAKRVLPYMEGLGKDIVVCSGVRSPEELIFFRSKYPTILIEIRSDERIRFERILKRSRPSDPKTWEAFLAREASEKRLGVEDVIKMADIVIENNETIEAFEEKVERFLRFIRT